MKKRKKEQSLSENRTSQKVRPFASESDCCGCGACRNICPRNAIAMCPDEKGFSYPHVNQTLCTGCGICRDVCPMEQKLPKAVVPEPEFYAVKHQSDDVRMNSSSGGMFTALSDWILERGGSVYGAAFDDSFRVCHKRAGTKKGRDEFCGSKYLQSDMGRTFAEVKKDLESGLLVLFSGTPCQAAGLSRYLFITRTDTSRLYLCDLICHGIPSPQIFLDYLNLMRKKNRSDIQRITFRYKPLGWRAQAMVIEFCNSQSYCSAASNDLYYRLFSPDIILRPSCYQCPFASVHRLSDITIGDFWGIENSMPEFEDEKGVSLVLTSTPKGCLLFQSVKDRLEIRPVCPEQGMQWNLKKPSVPSPKTDAFWADYQVRGFEFVAKKYATGGIKGKIKSDAKRVLKYFGLFDAAKRVLHK